MSEPNLSHDIAVAAGKLTISAPATAWGFMTVNNLVAIVGGLASVAILVHTILKIWWDVRDRRARRAAGL